VTISNPAQAIPAPPTGYEPAILFKYPKYKLQLAAAGLLLAVAPLLYGVAWLLRGRPAGLPFVVTASLSSLLWVCATVLATVVVHELVHGLAYQLLGYKVSYGASLRLFAAYAAAFGQWQRRNHNLIVALAPLLGLTLLLLPLLALPNPMVALVVFTALLFNTGGAIGDLYLAWRLLRLPPATLLYDVDVSTMLIYRPVGMGQR
jgi:hypothetical protein